MLLQPPNSDRVKPTPARATSRQVAPAPSQRRHNVSGVHISHQAETGMDGSTPMAFNALHQEAFTSPCEEATAPIDPHLRRLHDAAAAWARSNRAKAGHTSGSATQQAHYQAIAPHAELDSLRTQPPGQPSVRARSDRSDRAAAAATVRPDNQMHGHVSAHDTASTDMHLPHLEASAATWQQSSGALSMTQMEGGGPATNDIQSRNDKCAAAAMPMHELHQWHISQDHAARQHSEPAFSRRHDTDHLSDTSSLDDTRPEVVSQELAYVPPPPPRPARQRRASWWAAIKGDAPPWLL